MNERQPVDKKRPGFLSRELWNPLRAQQKPHGLVFNGLWSVLPGAAMLMVSWYGWHVGRNGDPYYFVIPLPSVMYLVLLTVFWVSGTKKN